MTKYDVSDIHCLKVQSGDIEEFGEFELMNDGTEMKHQEPGNLTYYMYERLDELPELCEDGGTGESDDDLENFDALWQNFDDYYVFFDLWDVDWDEARETYRTQVGERDLFDIFTDMLTPLEDGHIILENDTQHFSPGEIVLVEGFSHVMNEFEEQTEFSSPQEHFMAVLEECAGIVPYNYLSLPTIKIGANEQILWGTLKDNSKIGYLASFSMYYLCDVEGACTEKELAEIADEAMKDAMKDLADVDTIIVDVRFNMGGSDAVAKAIAEYFTDGSRVGFIKKPIAVDGRTEEQIIKMDGDREERFEGDVITLISPATASAGEVFMLMMNDLPNMKRILGQHTWGIYSDALVKTLPNGWYLSLSNEIYTDADGESFEGVGISPDETITVCSKEDRENGSDSMMDRAIEIAEDMKKDK